MHSEGVGVVFCELKAGRLDSGELVAAIFNLGLDVLEDIPLVCKEKFTSISVLDSDGELRSCEFELDGDVIRIKEELGVLGVKVLIFK